MAVVISTPSPLIVSATFDFNKWSYEELSAYVKALQSGNLALGFNLLPKILVSLNVNDVAVPPTYEGILTLPLADSHALLRFVGEELGKLAESIDTSQFPVDLARWNTSQWLTWMTVLSRGNANEIEQWLREVVAFPEGTASPLRAMDAAVALRGVQEAYAKVVSGKP